MRVMGGLLSARASGLRAGGLLLSLQGVRLDLRVLCHMIWWWVGGWWFAVAEIKRVAREVIFCCFVLTYGLVGGVC